MVRRILIEAAEMALLAAGYVLAGRLGLRLASVHESATPVWAPTGLSIASLVLGGLRFWPGVAIGAYVTNLAITGPGMASAGIALGNTLEALVGAWLVLRFAAGRRAFDRAVDTIRFCVLAGMVATLISASIGAAWLHFGGFAESGELGLVWITWWLGDLGGALLVAPPILLLFGGRRPRWTGAHALEAAVLLALTVAVSLIVFGGLSPLDPRYPVQFLCMPALVWVACRFSPLEASFALLLTAGLALWGTLNGLGPFAWSSTNESLLLLQCFMSVTALTVLILAAAVNERNLARAALERTTHDLMRSNADLERFAHAASHDLKEPLRSVVSFTQLLAARYRGKLGADADEFIRFSVQGAARLGRLIDDLLAYSRAGRQGGTPALVPASDALAQALARLDAAIAEARAVVTQDELPTVRADAGEFVQVLQNLVGNSVKFRGEQAPRVHVSACREGGAWRFSVRDNGIGIDPRFADRVFTMFQRLHKRDEYDGSGIGLALCKRVIERNGGRIWLESRPGEGTTVHFTWPDDPRNPPTPAPP